MKHIYIDKTTDTPEVILDLEKNIFKISGISMPNDTIEFYKPILDWIEKNLHKTVNNLVFEFELLYLNTASCKMILYMLLNLDEVLINNKKISVKWNYDKLDKDILEMGMEYSKIVEVPFYFHEKANT